MTIEVQLRRLQRNLDDLHRCGSTLDQRMFLKPISRVGCPL
jgi:hypothetical protein